MLPLIAAVAHLIFQPQELLLPSMIATNPSMQDCAVYVPEKYPIYAFANEGDRRSLKVFRDVICKRVDDQTWSIERANEVMDALVIAFGVCDGPYVNRSYGEYLEELSMPEPVIAVNQEFCWDVHDQEKHTFSPDLVNRVEWLRKESFCQISRYIADPGGWLSVFEPDLPSVNRLREQAISLCDLLRGNKIELDEAQYRFDQELRWMERHLGPEALEAAGTGFESLLDAVGKLLGN